MVGRPENEDSNMPHIQNVSPICSSFEVYLQWYSTIPYPIIIFDVGISSFANNAFGCTLIVLSSCNMQGSLLMERITLFIANEIDLTSMCT